MKKKVLIVAGTVLGGLLVAGAVLTGVVVHTAKKVEREFNGFLSDAEMNDLADLYAEDEADKAEDEEGAY